MPVMWVGTCCFAHQKQCRQSQTQAENQTYFRRSAFKTELSPSRSNERRASMHSFITARAGVYAMMGSLPDDQARHSPDYVDETNVQSGEKCFQNDGNPSVPGDRPPCFGPSKPSPGGHLPTPPCSPRSTAAPLLSPGAPRAAV